jgi:hypothetical protein
VLDRDPVDGVITRYRLSSLILPQVEGAKQRSLRFLATLSPGPLRFWLDLALLIDGALLLTHQPLLIDGALL